MPKIFEGVEKLWEVPIPEPVLSAPVVEKPVPIQTRPIPPPVNSPERLPVERDPIARTALSNASTNAELMTDGLGGMSAPAEAVFLPAKAHPPGAGFVFGPGTIYPALSLGANYETGRSVTNDLQGVAVGSLAFVMGEPAKGKSLAAGYGASYRFPTDQSGSRPVDQQLELRALLDFTKLRFGLGISYNGLSGVNRDVGRAVDRDLVTVSTTASYQYSPKTSLDWDISVPLRQFSDGVSSAGVTSTTFLNFQYTPKTTLGLGVAGGVLKVTNGPTQTFGQVLARSSLAATEIFSVFATGGAEVREAGDFQKLTPIFGIGATWTPRLGTSFSLTADRRTQNSATASIENFTTTSVAFTATQRLGSRMNLQMSLGYEDAQYYSVSSAITTDRRDHLYLGQLGLNAQITTHWTAQLQYVRTENQSTSDQFTQSRTQLLMNYNF